MLYGFERNFLPKVLRIDRLRKAFNLVRTASRPYLVCETEAKIEPKHCLAGFYRVRFFTQSSLRGGFLKYW